jgi:hypothetical protein
VEADFLPTVAVSASVVQGTPIPIGLHGLVSLPIVALDGSVAVVVGGAAEVLPVVRVVAALTVVGDVRLGTPDRLEVEKEEVLVLLHVLKNGDRELVLMVRESTKVAELALVQIVRIHLTVLGLVLLRVVEVLHAVMRFVARVAVLALLLGKGDVGAHLGGVGCGHAAPIAFFSPMVEYALLRIMRLVDAARLRFVRH